MICLLMLVIIDPWAGLIRPGPSRPWPGKSSEHELRGGCTNLHPRPSVYGYSEL